MSHQADRSFFNRKLPWSKRKDRVLDYYLEPYLAKVSALGRPILIVDGFAGRGQYRDGEFGSPLIIAKRILAMRRRPVPVQLFCSEADEILAAELEGFLRPYSFAKCKNQKFLDAVEILDKIAASHTVFPYLDPYAIEGLLWNELDRVFRHVRSSGSSIEVLVNFSGEKFARRARAALKLSKPEAISVEDCQENDEDWQAAVDNTPSMDKLCDIVGGDWWREIIGKSETWESEVALVTQGYSDKLRTRFDAVCSIPIKAKPHHKSPKYALIFGSRYPPAIQLMNNAAVKSLEMFADENMPAEPTMFELRSEELVPDLTRLPGLIQKMCLKPVARDELIFRVIREDFGCFLDSQISAAIRTLIKNGVLVSESGRARINGKEQVWVKNA